MDVSVDSDCNITADSPLFRTCRLARQDILSIGRFRADFFVWGFDSVIALRAFCSQNWEKGCATDLNLATFAPQLTRMTIRVFRGFSSGWPADPCNKMLQPDRIQRNLVIKRHLMRWDHTLISAVPKLPCLTRVYFDLRWDETVEDRHIQRFMRATSKSCHSKRDQLLFDINAYTSEEQRESLALFRHGAMSAAWNRLPWSC